VADSLSEDRVDPDERISRYLLRPKWFSLQLNRVFAQAFNPPRPTPEYPIRQTSIYRTEGLPEADIWNIGNQYVTNLHPKQLPVLARADLRASDILNNGLQLVPHPDPHPRHADIEGWPSEDEQIEMKLAYLSSKANLIVKP